MWGEISSSSWGKETIRSKVTPPGQGSLGARSNASLEKMNKTKRGTNERKVGEAHAQENRSKMIQAKKTLESRIGILMAAILRCQIEVVERKSFSDVEASKDAVEVAWRDFQQASSRYCMYAGEKLGWIRRGGEDPFGGKEFEEQPEEVRRAWYEWKALLNMMEQVVEKAEEYLESATKENSWGELCCAFLKDFEVIKPIKQASD